MRDRLKEQEQRGAVDARLQAAWSRLHQRSIYLNSIVLLGGAQFIGSCTSILNSMKGDRACINPSTSRAYVALGLVGGHPIPVASLGG